MTRSRLILSLTSIVALLLWTGTFAAGVFPLTGQPKLESAAPAPSSVQQREPIRVGGSVQETKLIRKVMPVYPELAKRARIEGTVILQVLINEDGIVTEVKTLQSHPLLEQAAIDAVRQWRYSSTLLNGAPVPVLTTVNVEFKLSDSQAGKVPPPPRPTGGVSGGLRGGIEGGVVGGIVGGGVVGGIVRSDTPQSTNPGIQAPGSTPMRVGGNVQESKITYMRGPVYPELAKWARVETTEILEATINEQGEVYSVRVIKGHPLLDQAAIDAVRQWRYQPTYLNGVPVPVVATVTVDFSLSDVPRVVLNADGTLKDYMGQPVSLQQVNEAKNIVITINPEVPFSVAESTLNYLRYQGTQTFRLISTAYTYHGGRLFYTGSTYTGPTSTLAGEGLEARYSNPAIQEPILNFDLPRLVSIAKASGRLPSSPNSPAARLLYILYISQTGEILDVQSSSMYDLPEVVAALRQLRVTPGQRDGAPVPTAVTLSIVIQ